jgi:hypothetical protein
MSSVTLSSADSDLDRGFEYRPMHSGAIASLVFGLLSVLVALAGRDTFESAVLMTPLPLIGLALGYFAVRRISATPDMYKGLAAARAGIALSLFFLVAGIGYAGYVSVTEVPEGYAPMSFADLKPDEVDLRGNHIVPPDVAKLDGQKVFIKGYFRPDSAKFTKNVKQFLLVRDNNQCCFGDMSTVQFFDQMSVAMSGDLAVDYKPGLYRMGGKLHIKPENAVNGSQLPVYVLEADHAE